MDSYWIHNINPLQAVEFLIQHLSILFCPDKGNDPRKKNHI